MGPARFKATVTPQTLGRGKQLSLRLIISDGLNTSTVNAQPISLGGR